MLDGFKKPHAFFLSGEGGLTHTDSLQWHEEWGKRGHLDTLVRDPFEYCVGEGRRTGECTGTQ
jgi:hypothetical protein